MKTFKKPFIKKAIRIEVALLILDIFVVLLITFIATYFYRRGFLFDAAVFIFAALTFFADAYSTLFFIFHLMKYSPDPE